MQNLTIGVHIVARDTQGLLDGIEAADHAGIDVAWLTSSGVAPDPLAVFAAAAGRVQRIQFGTSIVPTFPRHPLAMAQGALVVDSLAPGRLRLGVGPSHKPTMEGTFGIPFQRPQEHLREYLTVLNALLKDGKVSHHGARLHADAGLAGPTGVRVMASALRGKAFRLCGELTDGAISWVCPPAYLREVALPALEEGAAAAGRPTPALVAHVPVVVSDDPTLVRDAARQQLSRYPTIPYYRRMFQDAGFPAPRRRRALRAVPRRPAGHASRPRGRRGRGDADPRPPRDRRGDRDHRDAAPRRRRRAGPDADAPGRAGPRGLAGSMGRRPHACGNPRAARTMTRVRRFRYNRNRWPHTRI